MPTATSIYILHTLLGPQGRDESICQDPVHPTPTRHQALLTQPLKVLSESSVPLVSPATVSGSLPTSFLLPWSTEATTGILLKCLEPLSLLVFSEVLCVACWIISSTFSQTVYNYLKFSHRREIIKRPSRVLSRHTHSPGHAHGHLDPRNVSDLFRAPSICFIPLLRFWPGFCLPYLVSVSLNYLRC